MIDPATSTAADWPSLGEIIEVATLRAGLNTTVVILGTTMLGVAAGIAGVFALLRRRSLVADALGHATLPGIAIASSPRSRSAARADRCRSCSRARSAAACSGSR